MLTVTQPNLENSTIANVRFDGKSRR